MSKEKNKANEQQDLTPAEKRKATIDKKKANEQVSGGDSASSEESSGDGELTSESDADASDGQAVSEVSGGDSTSGEASSDDGELTSESDADATIGQVMEELTIAFTNNSQSGLEVVLDDAPTLVIAGHAKNVTITTTKEKLVDIQANLAAKPWIEIHVVEPEDAE